MLVGFFFLLLIHFTTSISNQEDLSISNYSHIACLTLHSDKQHLIHYIQTNSLLAFQTFSSSNMTIELCFRLCRQWIILINPNRTNCICLYTMNKPYEFTEYLGEISSVNNCNSSDLQIYSLTNDFYTLPSLSSFYEWSFDGCYYLDGIQDCRANRLLTTVNHTQAITLCREHCQITRNTGYFSFFLSLKQSCYCLPITPSKTILHTAVRKPLIHCSFLSYIKNGFDHFFNYSEINPNTVVKIDVQRYCSSTFIFDRNLHLCFKLSSLNIQNTSYSKINSDETCLPILIKTSEQWKHLISFSFIFNTRTLIWIDRNSTYIVDDLFKSKNNLLTSNDLCIVVNQTNSNRLLSYDLVQCSTASWTGYVLCAQKPVEMILSDNAKFRLIHNAEQYPIVDNVSCPSEFVLFNNICYYVHTNFVYNQKAGENLCSNKYFNSTLVKLNSHEWANINATRFLGRTSDDILLELFYYQLEKNIKIESKNHTNKKHWLRLLVVDKNPDNECILRYFIRSAGVFTILSKCEHGGHPVCQCESIRNDISKIISVNETTTSSFEINNKTISTTTEITLPILSTSTNLSIVSNETSIPTREPISDEDLLNNETNTDYKSDNITLLQSKNQRTNYSPLLMMITGPLLGLVILTMSTVFVIRYFRRSRGSYSTHSNIVGPSRRTKRSSKGATLSDVSSTPSVLYSRLKSFPQSVTIDADMIHPFDNSITIDDNVQLLPEAIKLHENIIPGDEEEPLHATLKLPNEK